jgi:hypothetical protein
VKEFTNTIGLIDQPVACSCYDVGESSWRKQVLALPVTIYDEDIYLINFGE